MRAGAQHRRCRAERAVCRNRPVGVGQQRRSRLRPILGRRQRRCLVRGAHHLWVGAQVRCHPRVARLGHKVAVVTAPWEHLVRQSDIIAVNPQSILLAVWPTGGAEG